jgi:hypothetical protein
VLVDRPVAERVEHGPPAEQAVRPLAAGAAPGGVGAAGPHADAVRHRRDPGQVLGAVLAHDVLGDAAHPGARQRLDQPEEDLDRPVPGRDRPRVLAPRAGGEVEAAAHVVPGEERDPQLAGEEGA